MIAAWRSGQAPLRRGFVIGEPLSRRTVLARSLAVAGLLALEPAHALAAAATALRVANVTELYTVEVARVVEPRITGDVVAALADWPGQVAVGGGRYSMGGQVAIRAGLHIDMRSMRRLVWLHAEGKRVRVEAGMTWRDLLEVIDPLGLAIKTMQSYANFTVGGAVSVNAHGRYVGHGPIGNTVRALQLVLADGRVVEATPDSEPELFAAAIGGYGAVGVITEVELELADNGRIEREVADVALADYPAWFQRRVLGEPTSMLHNADLVPPRFDAPVCTTWRSSDKPLTEAARLIPRGERYLTEQAMLYALTELPGGARLRGAVIRPMTMSGAAVQWRNHEASHDVAELEPHTRRFSTYALQEYFVPERNFGPFAQALAAALIAGQVGAVNVSVRHAPADRVALMRWAREDVFSFVLYYKQGTTAGAREAVGRWTRKLIDLALAHGGTYYLPYQLHATQAQFDAAYPMAPALRAIKQRVDPRGRLTNTMWVRYLGPANEAPR